MLEIGCGVGRISRELAPRCRSWTGSDISKNLLTYAAERFAQLGNVRLQQLHGDGLGELADASFDRVLRPGGRLFMDTIDIESNEGWGDVRSRAAAGSGGAPALHAAVVDGG